MTAGDLIAIGAAIIVIAYLIARVIARTVLPERRPKLPSYESYCDGLTAADVERIHSRGNRL